MNDWNRFTLRPGQWYAMLLLGDEFDASAMCTGSPSPIRVNRITPLNTGQGLFRLQFFHANYPEGVQDKEYTLHTLHRGCNGLLARSDSHNPPRFLYLTDVTINWLKHNFPNIHWMGENPGEALNRQLGTDQF